MVLLPAFLASLESQSPAQSLTDLEYQSVQFTHNSPLGSSHVLWWPSPRHAAEPDTILFFIPGNPGLVDFYVPFLSAIHSSQVTSNLAIVAQAHLDHYPGIRNNGSRYRPDESLAVQVQNSLDLLEAIDVYYDRKPRIIIVGHSVGCWISLQVLKTLPKERVEATFLLFPTISSIGDTPNGRALAPIFWPFSRSILASLSFIAKCIPSVVLATIYSTWPENQLRVLKDFISSGSSIYSSLSMAAQEMKTIRELDVDTLSKFKDSIYFYYADSDRWVGKEREVVLRAFDPTHESTQVVHGPVGIPHAFCINDSEPVAKQCCEWIAKTLGSKS